MKRVFITLLLLTLFICVGVMPVFADTGVSSVIEVSLAKDGTISVYNVDTETSETFNVGINHEIVHQYSDVGDYRYVVKHVAYNDSDYVSERVFMICDHVFYDDNVVLSVATTIGMFGSEEKFTKCEFEMVSEEPTPVATTSPTTAPTPEPQTVSVTPDTNVGSRLPILVGTCCVLAILAIAMYNVSNNNKIR